MFRAGWREGASTRGGVSVERGIKTNAARSGKYNGAPHLLALPQFFTAAATDETLQKP
jgi:hypothetical protein